MDQKPQIPTLKDSKKTQVKIKGLTVRLPFMERLKQFKKKDLAFILAGLGVLFMAPLAEHFMMSPENADSGSFKPGWDFMNKGGRFGDGNSPYESGVNGLAPGSFAGGGGDVITPLNVRDPSSLIMGPGASAQPAATSTTPPSPAKENTDWKDAIANAASKGASAATKAASLPVPKPSLTNAGLRGLGVGSGGGGGAQWSPPPISASHAPNTAAQGNSLGYVSKMPGYAGVGSRGPENGSAGSMDALKKAAANAGSALNRQGSAATNAEQAAGINMPGGSGNGGVGEGGLGKDDKGDGANGNKDSKSLGESLAFMAAKQNMQHAIDLAWKLKEKDAMLWPDLKQKILEEAVMTPMKAITAGVVKSMDGFGGDKSSHVYNCKEKKGISPANIADSCDEKGKGLCFNKPTGEILSMIAGQVQPGAKSIYTGCTYDVGAGDENPSNGETAGKDGVNEAKRRDGGVNRTLEQVCSDLQGAPDVGQALMEAARKTVQARDALNGNPSGLCKASSINEKDNVGGCVGCVKGLLDDVETSQLNQGVVFNMNNVVAAVGGLAGTASKAIGDDKAGKTKDALDTLPEDAKDYKQNTAINALKYGEVYGNAQVSAKTAGDAQAAIAAPLVKAETDDQTAKRLLGQVQKLLGEAAGTVTTQSIQTQVQGVKDSGFKDAASIYSDLKSIVQKQKSDADMMALREANLGKSIIKAKALAPAIGALNDNGNNVANTPNMQFQMDKTSSASAPAKVESLPDLKAALETTITANLPADSADAASKKTVLGQARADLKTNSGNAQGTLAAILQQATGQDGNSGLKQKVEEVMDTNVNPESGQ